MLTPQLLEFCDEICSQQVFLDKNAAKGAPQDIFTTPAVFVMEFAQNRKLDEIDYGATCVVMGSTSLTIFFQDSMAQNQSSTGERCRCDFSHLLVCGGVPWGNILQFPVVLDTSIWLVLAQPL